MLRYAQIKWFCYSRPSLSSSSISKPHQKNSPLGIYASPDQRTIPIWDSGFQIKQGIQQPMEKFYPLILFFRGSISCVQVFDKALLHPAEINFIKDCHWLGEKSIKQQCPEGYELYNDKCYRVRPRAIFDQGLRKKYFYRFQTFWKRPSIRFN